MNRTIPAALLATALLTACTTTRAVVPLRPDLTNPERMVCEPAGVRPTIPAEHVVNRGLATAAAVYAEHDAYVRSIRVREGMITGYVLATEARLFGCSNNAAWWRQYWAGLPSG